MPGGRARNRRTMAARRRAKLHLGLLTAGLLLGVGGPPDVALAAPKARSKGQAGAARGRDVEQAVEILRLNREAMDLFEALELDIARKMLEDALATAQKAGLGDHLVAARTHANLGVVHASGLKDEEAALAHFKKAQQIKPDLRLSKENATPEAAALFARAGRELKGDGPGRAAAEPEGPPPADDRSPGALAARSSGPVAEAEEPAAAPRARRRGRGDEELAVAAEGDPSTSPARRLWLGLGLGSGGGYARGPTVEAYHQYVRGFTPGLAGVGLGHLVPEVGYFVTRDFALSLQGRHQFIPHDDEFAARGAHAVLARALFFFGEGPGRFYAAAAAGGGEGFRLVIKADTTAGRQVTDTVRGGPLLAGGGGGFAYAFGDTWSWMIETNLLAGFPDFSTVLDVNTGVRVGF